MEVGDPIVDGDEALQVSSGCEPLHDPLAPPRRQARILCPVVEALVLAMLDIHAHPGPGSAIRTWLVGDHHAWRAGWLADELAQELLHCELLSCAPTLAALNEGVGNQAISINGANMALRLAVDRDHDLVEMPLVAELKRAPTDLAAAGPAECLRTAPYGFVPDSWLTMIPRAASRSSTIRRLRGKRIESQTACWMTSAGNRSPRSMDVALVIIALKEPMFVDTSTT